MTITSKRVQTQSTAHLVGALGRLESFWRTHPAHSAATSLLLAAVLGATAVLASAGHDLAAAVPAYVAGVTAAIFGAFEVGRIGVSAGGTR